MGGIGYVVVRQLSMLAYQLPSYQERIQKKVDFLKPSDDTAFYRAQKVAGDVAKSLDTPVVAGHEAMDVRVVEEPTFRQRLQAAVGPYLEFIGVGSFVLILVLFMLMNREDLGDRIVQLFGQRQINLTTRTMGEIGQRISRYLAMITLVNSGYGLIVGLGLWAIGVPYAVLWGCLAAMMRFIPYVGAAVAFLLPLVFSVAHFPGWRQPLEVVAFFGAVEVALSYLEPVIYGKTTGVSALGLLVAAMFWTWLWGLLGTLLSTPMTLCLAVLGKYVPSLGFFATLLGEEAELDQNIRFYQRLVSLDQDGATAVVEAALKERPRAEVFDQILVPALSRAGRDAARGELEESDMAFIRRVIGEILDDLEGTEDISLKRSAPVGRRRARAGQWETGVATVRGRGRGGERHLRRPDAADAGTDPRPLEVHTRESSRAPARRCSLPIAWRKCPRRWSSCRTCLRRPWRRPATRSGGSGRGSPGCRSWWGAGGRPAATRRPRGSPESGPRTWPSRWPMPATRSWPGPLPLALPATVAPTTTG